MPKVIKEPDFKTETWEKEITCNRCKAVVLFFEEDLTKVSVPITDMRGERYPEVQYFVNCPCCQHDIRISDKLVPRFVQIKKGWI